MSDYESLGDMYVVYLNWLAGAWTNASSCSKFMKLVSVGKVADMKKYLIGISDVRLSAVMATIAS